eukprot:SAG11_NODE_460_length_9258_cov_3.010698_3_plen_118_part_00
MDQVSGVCCGLTDSPAYRFGLGVSDVDDPFFAALDVGGYNYSPRRYVSDHHRFPKRIMVGTESFPLSSFEMWDNFQVCARQKARSVAEPILHTADIASLLLLLLLAFLFSAGLTVLA